MIVRARHARSFATGNKNAQAFDLSMEADGHQTNGDPRLRADRSRP